jgi:hypothetical protein
VTRQTTHSALSSTLVDWAGHYNSQMYTVIVARATISCGGGISLSARAHSTREVETSRRRSHASLVRTLGAIIWLAGITHSLMSLARRQMSASCATICISITRNMVGDEAHLAHDPTADELANQAIGAADIIERLALRGCARVVGVVVCLCGVPEVSSE